MAKSGRSDDVIMTSDDGLPAALLCSLSISAAVANTLLPAIALAFRPSGSAAAPMRSTCAFSALGSPRGLSALSAEEVAPGTSPPWVSRIGARRGSEKSTLAATPSCHELASTRVTAPGRVTSAVPGNTAWATAAASATASAPPTRVVLRVAKVGKPSCCGRLGLGALLADLGRRGRALVTGLAAARGDDEGSAGKDERGEGTAGHPGRA